MPDDYRELAAKCRSLADRINDPRTIEILLGLAQEYDEKARGAAPSPNQGNNTASRPNH